MSKQLTPLEFITRLRETDPIIKIIYMQGGCYQFYKLLDSMFEGATPYKTKIHTQGIFDHVITCIDNKYYDIDGLVDLGCFCDIEEPNDKDIEIMKKWSYSKKYSRDIQCPNCNEPVSWKLWE